MSDRKFATDKIEAFPEERFGLGKVTVEAKAEHFPGSELLDTSIEIKVDAFSISWKDRSKLAEEIAAVIRKYLI